MAGILDFLNQNPEQGRSLLAAAAQMLQQSGPSRTPQGLGQIIGGGVGAYYESQDQQRARGQQEQLRGLQIKGAESDLLSQQRAMEKAQALSAAAKSAYRMPGAQAAMPGAEGMAQQPGAEGGFDTDAYINQVMAIDPAMGFQLQQSMKKAAPKYDSGITWANGPDGKPMAVRTADDGSFKQLDGLSPREKLEFRDTGNAVLGVNPYTGERQASLAKGLSPDAAASNALGYANLNVSKERLNFDKQYKSATEARAEREFKLKQLIGKAPTEFQGKSAAFGLRATEADKILGELKYDPAAINSKASVASWPLVGGALGAATNAFALTDSDQKAEQAQRDFINAVLRQESGAAIADSEFDNARKQYFPQPGDGDGVIAQKARARQLSIQGLQSNAGRAAMTAPAKPAASDGWSIRKVQ